MELSYTKEKLLLIKNINNQIREFKSKTLDIVYLHETNNNKNKLINDIKKLEMDLEIYKNIITKRKNVYIKVSFISCVVFIIFLISWLTNTIPSFIYEKINGEFLFILFCMSPGIIISSIISFCAILDNYKNVILCINSFTNLYNNLIYNIENKEN